MFDLYLTVMEYNSYNIFIIIYFLHNLNFAISFQAYYLVQKIFILLSVQILCLCLPFFDTKVCRYRPKH